MQASFLGRKFTFTAAEIDANVKVSGNFRGASFSTLSHRGSDNPYSQSGVRYRGLSC